MSAQVAPTRMALQMYKGKLVGAKKGYELLKKKSDALKVMNTGTRPCTALPSAVAVITEQQTYPLPH